MILDFLSTNKKFKILILCILVLSSCSGCSLIEEENSYCGHVYQMVYKELEKDRYYAIYEMNEATYLYEIYNSEGGVVWRDILYDYPTIQVYDSRYIEIQWGCGTGVWMDIYYDLETCFMTQPLEGAWYIMDGIVAIVVDGKERELHLLNPFSYSSYWQSIEMDFNTEMVNPSDCIIQLEKNDDGELTIEYWDEVGEKATKEIYLKIELLE